MNYKFFIIQTLFVISGVLHASPRWIQPERLVDKLSLQLRGRSASPFEKSAFKKALEDQPEKFEVLYGDLIGQWMKDPGYAETIAQLHRVWWRVPIGSVAQHAGEVVRSNRAYKEIYTRDYIYADGASSLDYQAFDIKTLSDLPLESQVPVYVPLAPDEKRFRGFFSSVEFLRSYPNTETNVNRKRSSQVFRIAFCETLQNLNSERMHLVMKRDAAHGSNPECIGCHRRLDPMARFFDQWRPPIVMGELPVFDATQASLGTVYLGGDLGLNRASQGAGDSDLGAIVVEQPEFANCIGRLVWRYVFGSGIAPDPPVINQLATLYKKDERFNPLVKMALQHPYFWSDLEAPPLKYQDVKPILKNCGTCHRHSSKTQFDPDKYPYRLDDRENAALLKLMWTAVNQLPGVRPMPEPPQPRLPIESIEALRLWISRAAENDEGQATLNDKDVEEILE